MKGRAANIERLKDELENQLRRGGLFKTSSKDALAQDLCVICGELAMNKCSTDAGRKEYYISAVCEECFDQLLPEE